MCPQNGEIKYRLLSPLWCTNLDTVATYNYYSPIVVSEPTVCFAASARTLHICSFTKLAQRKRKTTKPAYYDFHMLFPRKRRVHCDP